MESLVKIFAGTNSQPLAAAIAHEYGVKLGDATTQRFSDGEMQPVINESVRGDYVFLVQSTGAPGDNLLELLLMIDSARRASAGYITAVIPYFGYARQDRKDRPRVSIAVLSEINQILFNKTLVGENTNKGKKTKPMKSSLFLIATLALLALESCGPSAEQKASIEKSKMDSLLAVTKKATEDSISISNGMKDLLNRKTLTAKAIPYIQSEIEVAKTSKKKAITDMENIKSFQLGRTQSEKQSQIANQVNIQEQLEEHLSSFEAVLKVFNHALTEMDGIEKMKFTTLTEFETFKNDLSGRIQKMEKEIIDDSGIESLKEQFSFEKTITDETFIKKVMDYNKADSIATASINSINSANK